MPLTEEDLISLLGRYPIVVKHVSRLGPNRYRIDGPFDLYEVNIVHKDKGLMRAFVSDYAASRGFWRSQRFIRNLYDEQMVDIGNHKVLYVTDWFKGVPCTWDEKDALEIASTVAKLNIALRGAGSIAESRTGLNPEQSPADKEFPFSEHTNLLKEAFVHESKGKNSKRRIITWLEEGMKRAQWLTPILNNLSKSLQHIAILQRHIRWNITSFNNFIRFPNGRIGVLQKSDPVWGEAVLDLASLTKELCTRGQMDGIEAMIEAYQEITPLQLIDVNFLFAYSAFPTTLFRCLQSNLFDCGSNEIVEKTIFELEQEARCAHHLMRLVRSP